MRPVSYTHLDVYKTQIQAYVQGQVLKKAGRRTVTRFNNLLIIIEYNSIFATSCVEVENIICQGVGSSQIILVLTKFHVKETIVKYEIK